MDRIAGAVAREHVGEIRSDQLLDVGLHIAVAARRRGAGTEIGIDRRSCRRIVGEVRARAAVHRIAAGTAVERIVAAAAVDLVDAGAAGHGVMPLPRTEILDIDDRARRGADLSRSRRRDR